MNPRIIINYHASVMVAGCWACAFNSRTKGVDHNALPEAASKEMDFGIDLSDE